MKKIKSPFGIVIVLSSLIVAQNVDAKPHKICHLGNECIVSYDYTLVVPVTKNLGNQYACHVNLKNRELGIAIQSSGFFHFEYQTSYLSETSPDYNHIIQGRFSGENGSIYIDPLLFSGTGWATVQCKAF